MWCNILLLFIFGQIILQTKAVSMCTTESTLHADVTLNLNGTVVNGCYCSLKLHNADTPGTVKPKITFEVEQFSGCKYKLVISYKNTSPRFSCYNNSTTFHNINKTDEIKLYLESTSSQDDTTFQVKITSSVTDMGYPLLRLDCFLPNATETVSTTNTISTQPPTSAIMSTSGSTPTSLIDSTPKTSTSGSSSRQTSVSKSTTVSTPRSSPGSISDSPKTQITSESKISNDNDLDIGLIGGVVGGVLILIIVIIVIIVCIVRHRKKKREYSRPTVTRSEHGYTDIDFQAKGNNSSPGSVIIDNVPYDSADPALPQQPNNRKTGNSPVEMEIIENDLYVSSDDLNDYKSRDGIITNHNTDISNGQGEMEIIENDLYVSSDDLDDYKSRDGNITNHNPEISNDQSEVEIIENDLYVSSDDLDDYKSRDGNITNHNPEISNDQGEMEIIENDLYVSSDDALNSLSNDDNAPVYAVVNKKPKRPTSDVHDNSKDDNSKDSKDDNSKDSKDDNSKDDNSKDDNSKDDNSKDVVQNDLFILL